MFVLWFEAEVEAETTEEHRHKGEWEISYLHPERWPGTPQVVSQQHEGHEERRSQNIEGDGGELMEESEHGATIAILSRFCRRSLLVALWLRLKAILSWVVTIDQPHRFCVGNSSEIPYLVFIPLRGCSLDRDMNVAFRWSGKVRGEEIHEHTVL